MDQEQVDVYAIVEGLKAAGLDAHLNIDLGPSLIDVYAKGYDVHLATEFNREDGGWEAVADDEGDPTEMADGPLRTASVEEVVAWVVAEVGKLDNPDGSRTALFSGEWLLVDEDDASKGYTVAYEGTVYPDGYWSGGVQWSATPEVARALVEQQNLIVADNPDAGRLSLVEAPRANDSVPCGGCGQLIHVNADGSTECGGEGEGGCQWNIGEPNEDSDEPLDPALVKAAAETHEQARHGEPISLVTFEPVDGETYTQNFVGGLVQVPSWTWTEVNESEVKEVVR